jgi:amidase
MSAADLAAAIGRKKVSPVEVVDAVLSRIDTLKELNAYVTLDADRARQAAKAAERALTRRSARLGPLHGVPFSVKDLIITKDVRTTFGTPIYRDNVPTEDAPSVARLKAAGAIMLGKTNTPTLGWVGVTDNLVFGATRNPWSLGHTPGGSSGGAGAAVAAGLAPLALGTDGGGSIRKPAAWCGIYGLKASWGRIPVYPSSAAWSLSHAGPMTRTVKDAALMMNVCAGPDERDQYSLPAAGVDYVKALKGSLKGLRVAWSETLGLAPAVDPEVSGVAVTLRLLAHDLPRRHRRAARSLPRPSRRDRPRAAADRRGSAEDGADQVRPGLVRPARVVAACARVLRAVRPPALADRRLPAAPHRRVLSGRDRRREGRARGGERLHVPVQHDGPAGGDCPVRLHQGGASDRPSDRRAPLRRRDRAARLGGVRGGASVGAAPPRHRLT